MIVTAIDPAREAAELTLLIGPSITSTAAGGKPSWSFEGGGGPSST